jgi:hypothetical protein
MYFYHRPKVEDIELRLSSLPACPKISKLFVAYLEGLVAVSPY